MAERVFIVHRWEATTSSDWYPWLKEQLEKSGFSVVLVDVPDTMDPVPERWVAKLEADIGTPDQKTFLVGHSLGAQTVLKYLEESDAKIGGIVLVAPWPRQTKKDEEDPQFFEMSKRWLDKEPNWNKITKNTNGTIVIFSDNDPFVPLGDAQIFKERLNAKVIIEKGKGHFGDSPPAVNELQSALDAVIELSKSKSDKG